MSEAALSTRARDIVVDEVFPHTPEAIWKTLTSGALMERWLGMTPAGFEAVPGCRFTYKTTPAGAWDGTIRCEVLEVIPQELFAYSWRSGHEGNVGYGSPLDTVVTFTLQRTEGGDAVAPRAFGVRAASKRYGLQQHERRLDQGRRPHCDDRRRARLRLRTSTEHANRKQEQSGCTRNCRTPGHPPWRRRIGKRRGWICLKEKALTRARDALAAERRRMPWMAVDPSYGFEGPDGRVGLLDLFAGRRQLIVYRAFFEPGVHGWPEHGCRGCSMVAGSGRPPGPSERS